MTKQSKMNVSISNPEKASRLVLLLFAGASMLIAGISLPDPFNTTIFLSAGFTLLVIWAGVYRTRPTDNTEKRTGKIN